MRPLPRIDVPRPAWLDSATPEHQMTWENERQRGLHQMDCPDCKCRGNKLFRCQRHRREP